MTKYKDKWSRDELLLSLDLYFGTSPNERSVNNPKVISLAKIINRTCASVVYRLGNYAAVDPVSERKGFANGGVVVKQCFDEFFNNKPALHALTAEIRSRLSNISSDTPDDVTINQFEEATTVLANHLGTDKIVEKASRTEQGYLRHYLFKKNKISTCGICGRDMPVQLLIAAHIKSRSECSVDERRDIKNIVMPMCSLGCDDLFEKGFITISNGVVFTSNLPWLPEAINQYFKLISGRRIGHWSESSQKYFEWHKKYRFS